MTALDYGVEIEFLVPSMNAGTPMTQERVAAALTAVGVECRAAGYNHTTLRTWKIVSDASLRPGPNQAGFELVSPPSNENHLGQITKVCEVLTALGATVNKSCGLHVHVTARDKDLKALKRLAALYAEHEPAIDTIMPPSRRGRANSQYCNTLVTADHAALAAATDVAGIMRAVAPGKFYKVNYSVYYRQGTVEFRHHSGTVDANKIIKWIKFVNALVVTAVKEGGATITRTRIVGYQMVSTNRYWNGGRQRRVLYRLLTRPTGVTRQELQFQLNRRTPPPILSHLQATGARYEMLGRRDGHEVFHLLEAQGAPIMENYEEPGTTANLPVLPATLEGLCERLELPEEDKTYWKARAASFVAMREEMEAA